MTAFKTKSEWFGRFPSADFDQLFQEFETMFGGSLNQAGFPHYNIKQDPDGNAVIELALAGYKKDSINIVMSGTTLTISHFDDSKADTSVSYIHHGIAKRNFKRVFTLADNVEVDSAEMEDGLLKIHLKKINPNKPLAQTINIK